VTAAVPALAGVRAVLLDMDGTLVDSDAAIERAWRTWARRYQIAERDVLAAAHGHPADSTVRRLAPRWTDSEVAAAARYQLELQYADLHGVVANPGAVALLAVLARRRLPWAVVTSADERLARARLAAAGLPALRSTGEPGPERGGVAVAVGTAVAPLLVPVEAVPRGKPHPDGYLAAAADLGVEPAACLVVEDSPPGIAAGRAAGMRVAALRGLPADLSITGLDELAELLDRTLAADTA